MKTAVSRKAWIVGAAAVGLAAVSAWLLAGEYGPYGCAKCTLGMPIPDAATSALLQSVGPVYGIRWTQIGNIYIVCNGGACAHYRITDSGDFYGVKTVKQQYTPPPTGGGGGGEDSGGGSGGGGLGGVAPGAGGSQRKPTVIVHKLKPA